MQADQIITIIAYDIEGQAFQFAGKIGSIEGDKLTLSQVFNAAIESDNTPFEISEPQQEILKDFVINQYAAYRQLGLSVEESAEKINSDIGFLNEKF